MDVEAGGSALQVKPEQGATEVLGVAIAALVLVITFGSLLAAGLPLLTAIVGVAVGVASIVIVSRFVDVNAMISVFSGFILADEVLVKSIGFALAFGVLVDAFVVRMTIVPAVMSLLGRGAWWLPRWLGRILPNVDVEGAGLTARPDVAPAPSAIRRLTSMSS